MTYIGYKPTKPMRKIYLLLTICCALIACKKNSVDFTYTPTEPRAGQSVRFSNMTTTGEEWEWTFGDGGTASVKYPSHTYTKPGTYTVTLKVDKKKAWVRTKQVTIYDTIPTFVCNDTAFVIYHDYTFTANVYNPFNYDIKYEWEVPDSTVKKDEPSITCFFTNPDQEETVRLTLTFNNITKIIEKKFFIADQKTNSVLFRTTENDYRQRIFGERTEPYKIDTDTATTALLDAEKDTMQTYNGNTFLLSDLAQYIPGIQGFHIANRKIYFRADGLWVAHIDGTDAVQIDAHDCDAMTLDTRDNRIYWATEEGVWYMPFVGSDNNKFVTVPVQLNTMTGVTKLAADIEPK